MPQINADNDGGAAGPSTLKARALQDFAEVQKDRKGKAKKRKNKVRKALESCAIGRAVINFWVPVGRTLIKLVLKPTSVRLLQDLQTLHEYNYRGKGPDLWLSTKPPMLSAGVFIVAL